jgi:hypothetical protein
MIVPVSSRRLIVDRGDAVKLAAAAAALRDYAAARL